MGVLSLVLGAILLLWSHIILLVALMLSMYRFSKFKVRIPKRIAAPVVDEEPSQKGQAPAASAASAKTMEEPVAVALVPAPE